MQGLTASLADLSEIALESHVKAIKKVVPFLSCSCIQTATINITFTVKGLL
jgi:hypothetical protein